MASPPPPSSSSTSGIHAALRYTGIPSSWLSKRPNLRLPSRNWLIFLGTTGSLVGLYAYDRKRCRDIRAEYLSRVQPLAEEPLNPLEMPRKVTVYACKWPDDEDAKRGLKYFRRYIKPILNAAAIEHDVQLGLRHGALTRLVADQIQRQRRIEAGLEPAQRTTISAGAARVPPAITDEEKTKREREGGGSIIVGRAALKEYMEGLRRGWLEPPVRRDREEELAQELQDDGRFDEHDDELETRTHAAASLEDEPLPTISRLPSISKETAQALSPLRAYGSSPLPSTSSSTTAEEMDRALSITPPKKISPQPPLLLIPFTNHIGFRQIPYIIYDFFTQRYKVAAGAEAAYRLIQGYTRPLRAPPPPSSSPLPPLFAPDDTPTQAPESDLNFDTAGESYYKPSLSRFLSNIAKAREEYYKDLPKRLATARALARREREPTKEEVQNPPSTEVELRAERLRKEMRWRDNEEGWSIIRPEAPVVWDERFRGSLNMFTDPPEETSTSKTH